MEVESPEKLREIIRGEVERLGVRSVLERLPKKTIFDCLKHPLVSVVIGFLLTGVAGTFLTYYFQYQEKQTLLQREAHIHIREFSQALLHRTTTAGFLRSTLNRPVDKSTLIESKKAYDESVRKWNTDLVKHLFTFREYSGSRNPIFIERNIENDLVPILWAIDVCLTEEYDEFQKEQSFHERKGVTCWVLIDGQERSIRLSTLINMSRVCGYEISNLLFSWVTIDLKSHDRAWRENEKKVYDTISQRCNSEYSFVDTPVKKPPHRKAVPLSLWSSDLNIED